MKSRVGFELIMGGKERETTQKMLAIVVIIAMLAMIGIPAHVILFFSIVVYFVWRAVQHSEQQDTERVFDFYREASDVLRDEERRWYGFEITQVIKHGERVLDSMIDSPPLVHFALGALYNRVGEHESAVKRLAFVVEDERGEERHHTAPSPELIRYVRTLRRLEREPSESPHRMAAIRGLERARRTRAVSLLADSRERLKATAVITASAVTSIDAPAPVNKSVLNDATLRSRTLSNNLHSPPTPANAASPTVHTHISDVLRDVYEDEKKTA